MSTDSFQSHQFHTTLLFDPPFVNKLFCRQFSVQHITTERRLELTGGEKHHERLVWFLKNYDIILKDCFTLIRLIQCCLQISANENTIQNPGYRSNKFYLAKNTTDCVTIGHWDSNYVLKNN